MAKIEKTPMREKTMKDEEKQSNNVNEELMKLQEAIEKMPVLDTVVNIMANLVSTAYKKMGLPDPANAVNKDMAQSKQAIDCVDALFSVIGDEMKPGDADSFKRTLANLKLAYAKNK